MGLERRRKHILMSGHAPSRRLRLAFRRRIAQSIERLVKHGSGEVERQQSIIAVPFDNVGVKKSEKTRRDSRTYRQIASGRRLARFPRAKSGLASDFHSLARGEWLRSGPFFHLGCEFRKDADLRSWRHAARLQEIALSDGIAILSPDKPGRRACLIIEFQNQKLQREGNCGDQTNPLGGLISFSI